MSDDEKVRTLIERGSQVGCRETILRDGRELYRVVGVQKVADDHYLVSHWEAFVDKMAEDVLECDELHHTTSLEDALRIVSEGAKFSPSSLMTSKGRKFFEVPADLTVPRSSLRNRKP